MSDAGVIAANAVHLDTVKLGHFYRVADLPSPEELERRGFEINIKRRENSGNIITGRLLPFGRHEPRLTVTRSDFRYSGINVEVSIAKLLDSNGLGMQTDDDIECALDAIEDCIRQRIGVEFDARTAKVKRLDVNADFPVGEHRIRSYIGAMSCPNSRMTHGTVGETTEQYHNRSRTLIAYGKLKEMEKQYRDGAATFDDVEAARGLLRVESRWRQTIALSRLAKKHGVPADSGHLLTLPVAGHIISTTLSQLKLDRPKVPYHARDQSLLECFGKDAPKMLGILEWRERHGEEFWKDLGWSPATYYRLKKELQSVNLWDTSPTDELPALAITRDSYNNYTSLSDLRIEDRAIAA